MDWKENGKYCWSATVNEGREEMMKGKDIQKGAWTEEEDSKLVEYIKNYGEHHWDFVARSTGLKRTGKSCRLRWLNYLRPGIRRGNFTLEEQLKILELYSFWGNRWSKIAESLHGRTDNEIKNFWRTRVRRQAKQLNCEVNSKEFRDIICYVLIPRLAEQVRSKSWEYNNSSISPAVLITSPVPSSDSSSSNDLFMADRNDKASKDCNSLIKNSPFQHDMDQFPTTAADDQFGEDIWNDENVNFLQQLLFGDNYCDI